MQQAQQLRPDQEIRSLRLMRLLPAELPDLAPTKRPQLLPSRRRPTRLLPKNELPTPRRRRR